MTRNLPTNARRDAGITHPNGHAPETPGEQKAPTCNDLASVPCSHVAVRILFGFSSKTQLLTQLLQ